MNEIVKTALIWNEMDQIKYILVDGDQSKFQGVYINSLENEQLQRKLTKLMYDSEGHILHSPCSLKEFAAEIRQGAEIVECGFLP